MARITFKLAFCLLALAGLAAVTAGATIHQGRTKSDNSAAQTSDSAALKVANAYLAACSKADLDALNRAFLDGGRATVLENASDEGTWEQYRDHHLMPELKEFGGIPVKVDSEAEQKFGATSVVRQVGTFEVPDPATPGATRKYSCAVTYVIVDDAGAPKIAHLHWSSRAARPATAPTR